MFTCSTRKRFSEKPIVAFTNSRVFILDYLTNPVWSFWAGVLSQTIPDCVRHTIGVFCYNFKSHTNIIITSMNIQRETGIGLV